MHLRILALVFSLVISSNTWAQIYCVKKSGTKVYSAPDKKKITDKLFQKNWPLLATGKKRSVFVEILDEQNFSYWMRRKDLSTEHSCLIIKKNNTVLREGPGRKYKALKRKTLEKDQAVIELGGEDGWTEVEYESGKKAWIELDRTWRPKNKIRVSFENEK